MVVLGILGWREYVDLAVAGSISSNNASVFLGALTIVVFGLAALENLGTLGLPVAVAIALYLPLIASLFRKPIDSFGSFQAVSFGSLYLGIPVFSAILLRNAPGDVGQVWFADASASLDRIGSAAPLGLALVLSIVLIVWLCDTAAYLAGSTIGHRKLAPHISPGKSIEGSLAGLVAAIIAGAVAFAAFGAERWQVGAAFGAVVGVAGQLGDLAESLMKRQAGVKDSGTLLPGHGGILDRIDALLFAFPAALLTVQAWNWINL